MAGSLTLIANPGSASRKYALYEGLEERASLHFEWVQHLIVCTLRQGDTQHVLHVSTHDMNAVAAQVLPILKTQEVLSDDEHIERIGLRVVAPGAFFLEDHLADSGFIAKLEAIHSRAPIHITATLDELHILRKEFKNVPVTGVSDSAFHITKPDYAWNYGISLEVADHFEIKRFGYHGLSVAAVVRQLAEAGKLPVKLVVCHLGSGASVTAVHGGRSMDTTMGYSPLEGIIMSTRSGTIDPTAVRTLKEVCYFDDDKAEDYLNNHSGLLGLGGSSDIRELLRRESDGDNRSRLALATYIHSVQKAIGQMTAVLGGIDGLVFTGTVGERSAPIRERISERLHYLDIALDPHANQACGMPVGVVSIGRLAHSRPVFVVATQEAAEIVRRLG
jgi:acetate kinase